MFFFRQTVINRIVFLFPFVILAILVVLSFFCHPAREDLAINYFNNTKGLIPFIREVYSSTSSRYFSLPLGFLILKGDFIITHYYLIPIALIITFWISLYYFIYVFITHITHFQLSKTLTAWLATLILVTFFAIAFDLATLVYWISGSITYLPSFILFLLLLSFLIKIFNNAKSKKLYFFFCIVCTICICGGNEISFYFLCASFFLIQWIYYSFNRKLNFQIAVLLIIAILCLFLLILPGGTSIRAQHFLIRYSLPQAILTSFLYTLRDIYQILSTPIAWTVIVIAWAAGHFTSGGLKLLLINIKFKPVYIFLFCVITGFLFYFLVYIVSGRLLPSRANNLIIFHMLIFILFTFFVLGIHFKGPFRFTYNSDFSTLVGIGLFVIFITNRLFVDGLPNLFAGYFYNRIMNARLISATQARQNGKKTIVILPYNIDFKKYSHETKLLSQLEKFSDKLSRYPDLIHYSDPVEDTSVIHYYAAYLKIDTIEFKGIKYPSIGLINKSSER